MKRFLYIIFAFLLILIALIYWSLSSTDKTFERSRVLNFTDLETVNFRDYDSVLVAASELYEPNFVKEFIQGSQYRDEWATPVQVPVLFLDTLFGGVTIIKEGGGKQTHSLKLIAENGIEYTLRSVNKDPEPLIPELAKTLGLENIVVDGISAQHPYGALLAARLSEAVGVLHTNPKLYFLPKQEKLESYNNKFGNRLFLLEYETEGDVNWTRYKDIQQLVDTEDLQKLKLTLKDSLTVDKKALIRARLFDFLIGDWDRHTKQWGFALQKTDTNYVAIPIAGDRDNAFFNTDGVIPSFLTNENVVPELRPFEDDIDFIEGLVYPFDRYFLINTPETLFSSEAKAIQRLLTNDVIDASLKVWPVEISALNGIEITNKIKSRRDDLLEYALKFKAEIDRQGIVTEDLKGSEGFKLPINLINCFICD
ncbi:hypothetical protein WNY78_17145 [Psychroserpens sp. AS72]|uniref:hypothetical protein n=1 Tax=Psychroserpens sp. AS72 TaxID=3135775 RepID=UPI00316FEDDC